MLPAPLQKLLYRAIDYAGVFPPARLPLSSAIEEFVRLVTSESSWVLRGFVVPAESVPRLEEFVPLLQSHRVSLPLVVIARSPGEDMERMKLWREDHDALRALKADYPDTFSLLSWEAKISQELATHPRITEIISELEKPRNSLFLEIPITQLTEEQLEHFFSALKSANGAGVKIRMGGEEPSAFPPPEAVARVLSVCAQRSIHVKATAGLHRALRWRDEEHKVWQHGFFNILFAFAFACKYKSTPEQLLPILSATKWDAFHFDEEGIIWDNHPLQIPELEDSRRLFVAFGSCSVTEPLHDLSNISARIRT